MTADSILESFITLYKTFPIAVNILEDNKYKVGETQYFKNIKSFIKSLLPILRNKNYTISGGNQREFYVINQEGCEYTFQISTYDLYSNDLHSILK